MTRDRFTKFYPRFWTPEISDNYNFGVQLWRTHMAARLDLNQSENIYGLYLSQHVDVFPAKIIVSDYWGLPYTLLGI